MDQHKFDALHVRSWASLQDIRRSKAIVAKHEEGHSSKWKGTVELHVPPTLDHGRYHTLVWPFRVPWRSICIGADVEAKSMAISAMSMWNVAQTPPQYVARVIAFFERSNKDSTILSWIYTMSRIRCKWYAIVGEDMLLVSLKRWFALRFTTLEFTTTNPRWPFWIFDLPLFAEGWNTNAW